MRALCKLSWLLVSLPLLVAADVYRWVDADGVVNYTQQAPKGVAAQRISSGVRERPTKPSDAASDLDAAAAADQQPELDPEQQRLLAGLRAAEQTRQKELQRVRGANCEQARSVLSRLTSQGRIRVRADDGSERVLPEEERQARIRDAQQGVAINCATPGSPSAR